MSRPRLPQAWRRLLAEPVLQFLLIGSLAYLVVGKGSPSRPTEIRISAAEQHLLSGQFERNNRRPPSPQELQFLIEQRIDERVLVREAQDLALDQGDEIVRRRLLQKMQFVLQSRAAPATPTAAQLQDYFRSHAERYAEPARYTLEHIYFRQDPEAAVRAQAVLQDLPPGAPGGSAGDHFDYGYRFVDRTLPELRSIFGPGFTAALQARPQEAAWFGPVRSLYGQHLLRITRATPALAPRFEAAAEQVYTDWLEAERKRLLAVETRALRERYDVRIEARDGR